VKALRLGTRASALARWQADWVAARLLENGTAVELVPITTQGDAQQAAPVGELGGQGVFTKEIQRALLDGEIDLAVHSLKDLTTEPVEGLSLAAVPERESVCDALVSHDGTSLDDLPSGSVIGTGSLRRQAQLLHLRGDLVMADIRGNVDTRLKRVADGDFAAIVLAEAGLKRLGWADRITQVLPADVMLPAVGQGALGIESRSDDAATRAVLARLDHVETHQTIIAERSLLRTLQGGCMAPVGAWGRVDNDHIHLSAAVLSPDGKSRLTHASNAPVSEATALGRGVAEVLLSRGAGQLLNDARSGPRSA